jgi:hypothetical protein
VTGTSVRFIAMTDRSQPILRDAELPPDERAGMTRELLADLEPPSESDPTAAQELWAREIERRAHRALNGTSTGQRSAAWREVPQLAEEHVGTPVATTVHDVLDVEIMTEQINVDDETFVETTVRFRMPPRLPGVLPGNWMEHLLPLVFPQAEPHEIDCVEASYEGWTFRWSAL